MKRLFKILLGVGILVLGIGAAVIAFKTRPEAEKTDDVREAPLVRVVPARKVTFHMKLPSQGLIEPRKKTAVAAEVGGKIISVSPKFKVGGEFALGETMVTIDPADYEAAVANAKGQEAEAIRMVADAKLALETERARAEQAKRDWERLGGKGTPSALTLRKPHVQSAVATVEAAELGREAARAAVQKAERDLERTTVVAPFDGRIEAIQTEVGSYLAPGSPVAEIYTTEPYEVRLPLSLDDWTLLNRDDSGKPIGEVDLTVSAGGESHQLKGRIVRTEGRVERESRSIYLVAEIDDPETGLGEFLVQPGLFVTASVDGKTFDDVIPVPVESFKNLNEVVVVDEEDRLQFKEVKILRRSDKEVLVVGGLDEGDRLSVTELSEMIRNTEVRTENAEVPDEKLTGKPGPKP